ncbi:MAG: aminodeoxychorismate synthase component I [Lentimicrobium sp.]|nr:aminodeoxychorismate synthase component I [Lentimicrobium sp.]
MFNRSQAYDTMNHLGKLGIPFLFIIDFECESPLVIPLKDVNENDILYNFKGFTNVKQIFGEETSPLEFAKAPIDFDIYRKSFSKVIMELNFGNSYLLNLTFPTPITINRTLEQIFHQSSAPYRLLFRDKFTFFSPEPFVRIIDETITSCPMKGTIDCSIPDAAKVLLNDPKELAEHNTIVDLIRNDLSMVAENVRVIKFRYLEKLTTNQRNLFQTSSEISGKVPFGWQSILGDIMFRLLPAGSISGAPKRKTIQIIKDAESGPRGYYTGVCGIFDGHSVDSAVMIRFIEKTEGEFIFRSGGGITVNSDAEKEYRELIDKVYVTFV